MTQFGRIQAETTRSEFIQQFPQLRVNEVMDIHDNETGEYRYSFFSVGFGSNPFISYIDSDEEVEVLLSFCQYITQAIADNQQSEEEDSSDPIIEMDGGFWCQVCQCFVEHETHIHKFTPVEAGDYVDTLPEF